MAYKDLINMQTNWGSFLPGGKPFRYNAANPTAANIYGHEYDTSTWQPIVDQTQDDRVVPTSGYERLDATGKAQSNYAKKNAAMQDLIKKNPDQLGTIDLSGKVNKMSMLPDISNINWSGILQGGKNIFGLGRDDIQEQVTETETIDPYTGRNMRDIAGEVGEYNNWRNNLEHTYDRTRPHMRDIAGEVGEYGNFGYKELNKPEGLNDNTSNFPSISHLINKITRPGADLSFAGYPDGTASRGGLYATEVANMQRLANMGRLTSGGKDWVSGKNVVSGFGDYNKGMQKNLERFEQTAEDKGFKDLDELEAYYKAQYGPIKNNAVLQRLKHAQRMTGGIDGGSPGDGGGKISPPGPRMDQSQYDDYMGQPGRDLGHGMNIEDRSQIADTWAKGGRVGYNEGGRVGILSVF